MNSHPSSFTLPRTLLAGAGLITVCELLLFYDVHQRGGLVIPAPEGQPLLQPSGMLGYVARWVALNMTALCWVGYLLLLDGMLAKLAWSRRDPTICSIRSRPNRFLVAWLTSIPIWCFFDWVNFTSMDAWRYHGVPPRFSQRVGGYFIAFAAISPGMFLAAQFYQQLGLKRVMLDSCNLKRRLPGMVMVGVHLAITISILWLMRCVQPNTRQWFEPWITVAMLLLPGTVLLVLTKNITFGSLGFGLGFTIWAVLIEDALANPALWIGLIFLLDPLSAWFGGPSILVDWRAGRWGRTLSLFAGGATCGLLWEFWNYWALVKWTYHLPFLGRLERFKFFEMPWVGFQGFVPFAVECWVTLNAILLLLKKLRIHVAEPLPDEHAIL